MGFGPGFQEDLGEVQGTSKINEASQAKAEPGPNNSQGKMKAKIVEALFLGWG